MKLAVLSESEADEAAIPILVDALLGISTEPISGPSLRSRGWPSVDQNLPSVLKHLHYRTEADVFVVVVDSDDSPVHDASHDESNAGAEGCRLCLIRTRLGQVQKELRATGRRVLKTAVGLACPCIEAWFRCGLDAHVTEAAWRRTLPERSGLRQKRVGLKRDVYGMDRPPRNLQRRRAMEEARRLARDLRQLERVFPDGFGALARDVGGWL